MIDELRCFTHERPYFCRFCYPGASDGTEAEEIAKSKGEKVDTFNREEIEEHYWKFHKDDIFIEFLEAEWNG